MKGLRFRKAFSMEYGNYYRSKIDETRAYIISMNYRCTGYQVVFIEDHQLTRFTNDCQDIRTAKTICRNHWREFQVQYLTTLIKELEN